MDNGILGVNYMYVARLQISGFRGIEKADLFLGKASVLVGSNNVGKTTIVEALALILGREGMVRSLTEHDFYGSDPQPADRIKIIATIAGFEHQDPEKHPEWFAVNRAVPRWLNPLTGDESALPKSSPYLLVCDIGFQARFDADSLEVETLRYFRDDSEIDDVFVDDVVTPVKINLVRDIGLFLIPANRSWDKMISFGSELFRRVVSSEAGLPGESIIEERDRLRAPEKPLENDERLKPVVDEVNNEIKALFGVKGDVKLRLTTTDSLGVLSDVVPHFDAGEGVIIPSKRQGSGLISLQSLFLLLHFGKRRVEAGKGFCLALEEPELHLPPTVQRRVLRRLKALSSQIIVSTHSPLIAGFAEPTELLILHKKDGVLTAKPLLKEPLAPEAPNAIRTLLQLKRVETATALMADAVLVPEGVVDFEWLALLTRAIELQSSPNFSGSTFATSVGIVPTQSSAVIETVNVVKDVHPNVFVMVDGDTAGKAYIRDLDRNGFGKIVRWPDEWTIEDVIGWVLEPCQAEVIASLRTELPGPPTTIGELVTQLKSDDRQDPNHLKGDRVAYETITNAIALQPECLARVGDLLDGLAAIAKGEVTPRFRQPVAAKSTFVFRP